MSHIWMHHGPEILCYREEIRFRFPIIVKDIRAVGSTEREVEFAA